MSERESRDLMLRSLRAMYRQEEEPPRSRKSVTESAPRPAGSRRGSSELRKILVDLRDRMERMESHLSRLVREQDGMDFGDEDFEVDLDFDTPGDFENFDFGAEDTGEEDFDMEMRRRPRRPR